ncbi:MAG: helix-turn-helix domain-containing protein [Candidatus Melainabacteria bacterium]|nr:helix-turn-helix domain-containing protein [Candidatus Melainabacteria bacterium]
MTEIIKKFGVVLKKARKEKKLSLRQVEKETGISYSYLSQLESGTRGLPGFSTFLVLGHFYPSYKDALINCYPQPSFQVNEDSISVKNMLEGEFQGNKIVLENYKSKSLKILVRDYLRLTEEGMKDLRQYLDYLLIKERKKDKN